MKYYVEVTRISYARQTIEVDVDSTMRARLLAMEKAPEADFSTYETEYEIFSVEAAEN